MDYTGMDSDRMFGAGDGVTLLDQIKADRDAGTPGPLDVCTAVADWERHGFVDECFWEQWPECPTEVNLTPRMVRCVLDENVMLRTALLAAGELLEFVELVHGSFGGGRIITFSDADIEQCQNAIASFRSAIEVK